MSEIDKVDSNKQPLPEKVDGHQDDINWLKSRVNDLILKVSEINKILAKRSVQTFTHTSVMPDYKADNADHDARYATHRELKKSIAGVIADEHPPVTVADTTTVDMSISGQQISAETIGLTEPITILG
ncbi:MAG: hypothetical protein PHE17_18105 [Thiothrix sp.]|uniref:hypothetical protein n=1 Tax=Thiothrix sp. TaxID=1032 RepID=UPI002624C060|nr:hypothetical protein [Thiothrix sp.]MDD5394935.1 hypothetical protein [Thiothrix sp.]